MHPEIYKGLYLAVPGIPDPGKYLLKMEPSILEGINFVFGFSEQDNFKFSFGETSNQEKSRYDRVMKEVGQTINLKYKSYIEDNGLPPPDNKKDSHELYQSMIDHIILSLQ